MIDKDKVSIDQMMLELMYEIEKLPASEQQTKIVVMAGHIHDSILAGKLVESEKYDDLIMSVGQKWHNETRHETAKRYILESEMQLHDDICKTVGGKK